MLFELFIYEEERLTEVILGHADSATTGWEGGGEFVASFPR